MPKDAKKELKRGFPLYTTSQSNAYKEQVGVKNCFTLEIIKDFDGRIDSPIIEARTRQPRSQLSVDLQEEL